MENLLDRVRSLESSDDVDWIVDVLALADQLLIGRLVNVCEVALMSLITLSNVGRLLHVACMCNAVQLESACMQMLCLNLPTVVELGYLDSFIFWQNSYFLIKNTKCKNQKSKFIFFFFN